MASILFLIETILRNEFRGNYLEKQKTFSQFFYAFLKSSLNFEHFQKKDDSHSWGISKITDPGKPCYINA